MKRQKRLEAFYVPERKSTLFFYVNWKKEPYKAEWVKEKPDIVTFDEEVRWKELNLFVTIYGYNDDDDEKSVFNQNLQSKPNQTIMSLVKSNLQKSIRRRIINRALETAKLFMKLDIIQFIRRLFIIMIEDVMIHESLPVLVWLTAAVSKGFIITKKIESWLLSIVHYLCKEEKETYHSSFISNDASVWCTKEKEVEYYRIIQEHENFNLLQSLLFRKSYGGLPGDLAMMMSFINLIYKTGQLHISSTLLIPQNTEEIAFLNIKDIMPCSVDFHCYPKMLHFVHEKYSQFEILTIKKAIWQHSSRFNYRVKSYQEDGKESGKLWTQIENYVLKLQRFYIESCIEIDFYLK